MAKTFSSPAGQTPFSDIAVVVAANTTLTAAPDDTVLLHTAGADGSLITHLWCTPRVTQTANVGRIYLAKAAAPTVFYLIEERAIAADTLSTTDAGVRIEFSPTETAPWRLAAGDILHAAMGVAFVDGVVFHAQGMHF